MSNLFQKIGDKYEKKKKKRKIKDERYWKLPATERLHYDSIIERLERNKALIFPTTSVLIFALLFMVGMLFLISFSENFPISELIEMLRPSGSSLIKLFLITIILDILLSATNNFYVNEEIGKLNKRFKLK